MNINTLTFITVTLLYGIEIAIGEPVVNESIPKSVKEWSLIKSDSAVPPLTAKISIATQRELRDFHRAAGANRKFFNIPLVLDKDLNYRPQASVDPTSIPKLLSEFVGETRVPDRPLPNLKLQTAPLTKMINQDHGDGSTVPIGVVKPNIRGGNVD